MKLSAIKNLIGTEKTMEQKEMQEALSKGLGREAKFGNTGRTDGKHLFDKNEEDSR